MRYTANQNLLFPHIYMLNRYANVDHYVSMNTAQFTKFGHQSRVEILDRHGNEQLLIIPLKGRSYKPLNEVEVLNPTKVVRNFLTTLQTVYGRQEAYKALKPWLEETLHSAPQEDGTTLAEFNNHVLKAIFDLLDIRCEWHDVEVILPNRPEHPSEWVADMGIAINCTQYLGGGTAQNAYLREEDFAKRGTTFVAQDYKMKPYQRGKDLQPRATVSCLDPLFYGGVELVKELIEVPAY